MAPDGIDRNEDPEARNPAAKEAPALKQVAGCCPSRVEYTSPSKKKKVGEDICFHDDLLSGFQFGDTIRRQEESDGQISQSSDNKGKLFTRKSAKDPIAIPSKRPKIDEPETCMKNIGSNGHDVSNIAGFEPIRCTADKPQIILQRRVHDGKRADKKNCRASMKNKYESLASKGGLVCGDTCSGGNSILGSHGLKSDIHDIAKQFDSLSLFELLNGNYKYSALPVDKGKKSAVTNDTILLSVRKVCSMLCPSPHVITENGCNSKACQSSQDPSFSLGSTSDYETKDKLLEDSITDGKNAFQPNWINSTLYQPKKILDRLALPVAHELEKFLFNPSEVSVPSLAKAKNCSGTDLPPFHWSFSHGTNNKLSVESCKVNATKNACQTKWVRIGRCSSLTVGDKYDKKILAGLAFTSCGDDTDLLNQQKIDNILELMKSSTFQPPGEGLSSKSSVIGTNTELLVEENLNLVDGFKSKAFQLHVVGHTLNSNCLEHNFKSEIPQEGTESVLSRCPNEMDLDPSKFNIIIKDREIMKDHPAGAIDGYAMNSFPACRNSIAQNCHGSCHYCKISRCKQGHPQEILSAAETLIEMATFPRHISAAKCTSGRNRWPKPPSMKKTKVRKPSTSINNPERSSPGTGYDNLIRKSSAPSSEPHPTNLRKTSFNPPSSSAREASRWSLSPNKVERDISQRASYGNNSFRPLLAPFSSSRAADKVCHNQIREPHVKPPSAAFKGSPIRDWIRSKNKRV